MIETPTEEQLRRVLDQSEKLAGRQYTIDSVEAFDTADLFWVPNEMPLELFDWLLQVWEVTATYIGHYGRPCQEKVVVGVPKAELQLVHSFREASRE